MSHKLLPWVSWAEWQHVGWCLFGEGASEGGSRPQLSAGVARVAAWRARGRVPLAADITASLVEAQLQLLEQQHSHGHQASAVSEHALRLMHALPIIRLVNGIADSQQRGRVASSVAVLSNIAGLPHLLVDIRHDATHGELPSLANLRLGSRLAMEWLKANYWDAQAWQLDASRDQITCVLATLLASCTAAAVKGAAPGPSSAGFAGSDSGGDEEDSSQPGGERVPWLPGLDQLLPGAAHATQGARSMGCQQPASPFVPKAPSILLDQASSYSAAEGRKQRRELLSQLRNLVPPAWVHALVEPLLDSAALHPPVAYYSMACVGQTPGGDPHTVGDDALAVLEGRVLPPATPNQQPEQGIVGRGSAPAPAAVAVAHKAWATCLSLMLKTYPTLKGALLQGCMHRLCHAANQAASPHSLQQHGSHTVPQLVCLTSKDSMQPPECSSTSHAPQQHAQTNLDAVARALYSWTAQLLGPPPPMPQDGGAGGKAGRQAEACVGGKQQCAEPHVLSLPFIQASPLSEQQLMQLLECLLRVGGSGSTSSQSSTSSCAVKCVRRLTAWLVHELQQCVSLAEEGTLSSMQEMQCHSGDSEEKGWDASRHSEAEEERAVAARMCDLPAWVLSAKELIRLCQGGARAPHKQSQPSKPEQQHLPQSSQPPGVSSKEEAGLAALDVTVLGAAQAQQALLVRRATEARRRRHQKHAGQPLAAAAATAASEPREGRQSQPSVCAQGELPSAETCHPMCADSESDAPEDRKRRHAHTAAVAETVVGWGQGQTMSTGSGHGRKRWRTAQHWEPCVIGCLPDALQAGGRAPTLELLPMQQTSLHPPVAAALPRHGGGVQPDAGADAPLIAQPTVAAPAAPVSCVQTELHDAGGQANAEVTSGSTGEVEGDREKVAAQLLDEQQMHKQANLLLQAQSNLTYL